MRAPIPPMLQPRHSQRRWAPRRANKRPPKPRRSALRTARPVRSADRRVRPCGPPSPGARVVSTNLKQRRSPLPTPHPPTTRRQHGCRQRRRSPIRSRRAQPRARPVPVRPRLPDREVQGQPRPALRLFLALLAPHLLRSVGRRHDRAHDSAKGPAPSCRRTARRLGIQRSVPTLHNPAGIVAACLCCAPSAAPSARWQLPSR